MGRIGVEWVNNYHGRASDLRNCDECAERFYDKLDGTREFNWGNDSAWDQDFEEPEDDNYADAVDIVFFAGHGSPNSILFGVDTHNNGTAGSASMRLGDYDCEWIVLDACQCLDEDHILAWQATFRGLHYILGFHTNADDSRNRGKYFARRLNRGKTVREAWIRACKLTAPNSLRLAYYRADDRRIGTDTYNDHWWDEGFVSSDPDDPDIFYYYQTDC